MYLFFSTFLNASSIELTQKEKEFIQQNKKIVLGIDKSLKPFIVSSENGTIAGFDVDVIKRINAISGTNFILKAGEIKKLRQEAIRGEIHGLASYTPVESEKKYFEFSQSYLQMQKLILAATDKPNPVKNLSELKGKTLAVYKQNFLDKQLAKEIKGISIKEYETLEDTILSVVTHEADIMFSNGSIFYIRNELGLPDVMPVYRLNSLIFHKYAINKEFSHATSILNKALQAMGKDELLALKNKWFSKNLASKLAKEHRRLVLDFNEKEYLISKATLKICVQNTPNSAYKKYISVNNELIEEVERLLLKNFERVQTKNMKESFEYLQDNRCDIIASAITTKSNNNKASFSNPYLEIPIVLATKSTQSSIVDINYLKKIKVAVFKNEGIENNILNRYANIEVYTANSLKEAFEMVEKGKVDGVAGALGVLSEYIKLHSHDFKINGTFKEKLYMTFAMKKSDYLMRDILNKTIDTIPEGKRNEIMNRYFGVKYEKGVDYTLVWAVAVPLSIALFFYILRIYDLKRINKKLQSIIMTELAKSRQKDNLIFQQNKLAATGELISTIAHQWKQPLSELGMSQNLLMIKIEEETIDSKRLMDEMKEQQKIVLFLSKTINTFKHFFDDEKSMNEVKLFKIHEAYKDIEFLIAESLRLNMIQIEENIDTEIEVRGNKHALSHLFLSILYNSIYFLQARDITNPLIKIAIRQDAQNIYITVEDNARGVDEEKLPLIFDFNYSFRDEKEKSTGLGLYICKTIIQEKFYGEISAHNSSQGLELGITLPKKTQYRESF